MSSVKLLIDTNILIGLEDNREIDSSFSSLIQKCQAHGVQLWIHEASRADIERDKDTKRRAVVLSKIAKFNELTDIPLSSKEELEAKYGRIRKPNDQVDVTLLHALHDVGAVDFLVTQDRGLRRRAEAVGVSDRVFTLQDALLWLQETYERQSVQLPYIEEKKCHQIDRRDDIFQSLQNDYDGFDKWFSSSCIKNHRPCWTVSISEELAGIAIHKDESFADLIAAVPTAGESFSNVPNKILKICTFKIKDKFRGEKFGEQLLKQALWWCDKNDYDFIYLSVFPKHKGLIDLLVQYGFEAIGRKTGELYLGKVFKPDVLVTAPATTSLAYHHQYYPAFLNGEDVGKYLIPIHGPYYSTLFPENVSRRQLGLFDETGDVRIPGNTIRKVYVCHTPTKSFRLGDILLFYHLKDDGSGHSRSLITVGVVDGFDITKRNEDLLRLTAKRSVFTPDELKDYTANETKDVKVINFLLAGHISPAIAEAYLEKIGVVGPFQSVRKITHAQYGLLEPHMRLNV